MGNASSGRGVTPPLARTRHRAEEDLFIAHMQWIAANQSWYADTVHKFRRSVASTSDAYRDVLCLFDWQRQHVEAEGLQNYGHVADLVGGMRAALRSTAAPGTSSAGTGRPSPLQ